ncbi:MAG: hypothetical protein LUH58_06165 [Lachnospiraceae bacterium]|nr:hypothetical protein [Lachnospiraceae bacterium]
MMEKPAWMQDKALEHIPAEKLEMLMEIHEKSKGKNQKELMAYFTRISQRQQDKNALTFTREELRLIFNTIKKYATQEEQSRIEKVIEKRLKL